MQDHMSDIAAGVRQAISDPAASQLHSGDPEPSPSQDGNGGSSYGAGSLPESSLARPHGVSAPVGAFHASKPSSVIQSCSSASQTHDSVFAGVDLRALRAICPVFMSQPDAAASDSGVAASAAMSTYPCQLPADGLLRQLSSARGGHDRDMPEQAATVQAAVSSITINTKMFDPVQTAASQPGLTAGKAPWTDAGMVGRSVHPSAQYTSMRPPFPGKLQPTRRSLQLPGTEPPSAGMQSSEPQAATQGSTQHAAVGLPQLPSGMAALSSGMGQSALGGRGLPLCEPDPAATPDAGSGPADEAASISKSIAKVLKRTTLSALSPNAQVNLLLDHTDDKTSADTLERRHRLHHVCLKIGCHADICQLCTELDHAKLQWYAEVSGSMFIHAINLVVVHLSIDLSLGQSCVVSIHMVKLVVGRSRCMSGQQFLHQS